MKKVAILQSNYIPWKGYFDLINSVDDFVLYDDMQYTRRDWRNRNQIKAITGVEWLTIPVEVKGKYLQSIFATKVSNQSWRIKHWKTLMQNYSKAKYFNEYKKIFEELYLNNSDEFLSQINYKFIIAINKILNIKTKIIWSSELNLINGQTERLVKICKDLKANVYISGPAAKNYLDEGLFVLENMKVEWIHYNNYKEYTQLYPPFNHFVSTLDLIFNEGENATKFMNSFGY